MSGRNDYKDTMEKNDLEPYLNESYERTSMVLKAIGKSEDEIQETLRRVKEVKDKIQKVVRKFRHKVERKYGFLDEAELIKKAIAYAAKGKLNNSERDVFIKHVLNGNDGLYYDGYLKHSNMSSFLGYNQGIQMLNVKAKDQAHLNELVALYNASKSLYYDIRQQTLNYVDCGYEALSGEYKPTKHIISQHIHPIVAMLFIPVVPCIHRSMLQPNIGRMVLSRAPLLANKVNLYDNVMPGDIESEFELGYAISQDPNSTNVFTEETPVENLTKRFQCQIELWKNVINLRSGRYYSRGYDNNDGISGFMKVLNEFNKIQYDVGDNLNMQDEGSILKKILGVFSIRPTLAQIFTTSQSKIQVGYTNITGLSRTTILNLPVVNIRLPPADTPGVRNNVHLTHALDQTDVFLKNKQLVPMNKSIMHSKDMIFFFAHRKGRTVNAASVSISCKNIALTPSFIGAGSLNRTTLLFNQVQPIGKDLFKIKGVIVLQTPHGLDLVTGCSASIVMNPDPNRHVVDDIYWNYNPLAAGFKFLNEATGKYESNRPITVLNERASDTNPGFYTSAYTNGCIFWYVQDK